MPKPSLTGRIILDESGKNALEFMLADLKNNGECVKVSPSKLVSSILEKYRSTSFEQDRESLAQAHFNSKEYLKKVLKEMNGTDNVADVLNTALKRISANGGEIQRPKRGRPKRVAVSSENIEENASLAEDANNEPLA